VTKEVAGLDMIVDWLKRARPTSRRVALEIGLRVLNELGLSSEHYREGIDEDGGWCDLRCKPRYTKPSFNFASISPDGSRYPQWRSGGSSCRVLVMLACKPSEECDHRAWMRETKPLSEDVEKHLRWLFALPHGDKEEVSGDDIDYAVRLIKGSYHDKLKELPK